MNERDDEIAKLIYGTQATYQEMQFADLIRADAMETATRAANESWTLLAKALVLDEREACAKVCENEAKEHERNTYDAYDGRYDWKADGANDCADAIRARGNT